MWRIEHGRRPAEREGFILILVLAMLALIAIIGVGFANWSGGERIGARARDEAFQDSGDDAGVLSDLVVEQVVCDTPSLVSFLRGHSLCRDLWGNDKLDPGSDGLDNDTDGQFDEVDERLTVAGLAQGGVDDDRDGLFDEPDEATGFYVSFALLGIAPQGTGALVGRTLVFSDTGPLAGEHTFIGGYAPMVGNPALGFVQIQTPLSQVPTVGTPLRILQRPFNGPGDRDLSDNAVVPYWNVNPALQPMPRIERNDVAQEPFPLYPEATQYFNFVYNGRHPETRLLALGAGVQRQGGFDEPWDLADLQNVFLAAVRADGTLILPSYWRPSTALVDGQDNDGDLMVDELDEADWFSPTGRMKLLRPRPLDQVDPTLTQAGADLIFGTNDDVGEPVLPMPLFLVPFMGRQVAADLNNLDLNGDGIPDFTPAQVIQNGIPIDIDNNGDGILDSIWTDPGLPIVTRPDGTRAKPLAAILIMDLDNKLNLNIHGNTAVAAVVDTNGDVNATPDVLRMHGSNLGASPSEVSIERLLSKLWDRLDNDGDGIIDEADESELADGIDNDNDGLFDLNDLDEMEGLAILAGRLHPQQGPIAGRHGELSVLAAQQIPEAGQSYTPPPINPVDDDNDVNAWRRAAVIDTTAAGGAGINDDAAIGDTAIDELDEWRRLFGLPDFNGDGRHQLRPWHLSRWSTIRNAQDQRDPNVPLTQQAVPTLLSNDNGALPDPNRWATLMENMNEADEFDPYTTGPFDAPFTLTDLEWLLRGHDWGGNAISTRLRELAPLSLLSPSNPALGVVRRRHFTTESWDWSDIGLTPDVWRDGTRTRDTRVLRIDPAALVGTVYNGYFDALGDGGFNDPTTANQSVVPPRPVPPGLDEGRRLRLDFPIGDGLDNDADGLIDEPDEPVLFIDNIDNDLDGMVDEADEHPPVGSKLDRYANAWGKVLRPLSGRDLRELQARALYDLLQQIAQPFQNTQTLTQQDLDHLAQLAVNIVDFRDPDDEMTTLRDAGGAQVMDANGNPFYGVEYPPLAINETMTFIREMSMPDATDPNIVRGIATATEFWVELYHTGNPNRQAATEVDLGNYRLVLSPDTNADNEPDNATAIPPHTFPLGTMVGGNSYVVVGTGAAGPSGDPIPLPNPDPNAVVLPLFLDAPFKPNELAWSDDWKVFLQRRPTNIDPNWVTVDQFRLKIWVLPDEAVTENMDTDMDGIPDNLHIPGVIIDPQSDGTVNLPFTEQELVSRERREPYRGGPINQPLWPPDYAVNYVDPMTMQHTLREANDVGGGAAVRNHPNWMSTQDPSYSLGILNWHSDVDDQNGDRMDVPATTPTKPASGFMADLDGDLVGLDEPNGLDDNGNGTVDEAGEGMAVAQSPPATFATPSVAWPPVPPDNPLNVMEWGVSRASGFGFLPWLDRDYANVGELLLVPAVAARDLTALYHPNNGPGGPYLYLADFVEDPALMALQRPRGLHRLLEFVEVPSRQKGYQNPGIAAGDENRRRRVPGKINVNTIYDPLVLAALADHPYMDLNLTGIFTQLFEGTGNTRNGQDGVLGTQDDQPFAFGHDGYDGTTALKHSLLRGGAGNPLMLPDDFGSLSTGVPPISPYYTARTGDYRNPWFKQEVLRKISGQVTTRSNVFAIWVTIGYFEVLDEPQPDGMDNDGDGVDLDGDGIIQPAPSPESVDEPDELLPRLGREVGSTTGDVVRHRAFYIVDRTRSAGFDPDLKDDVQQMVIYRSIIE